MRSIKLIETINQNWKWKTFLLWESWDPFNQFQTHSYRKMICQRFRWTFSISISIGDHLHHFFKWGLDFGLFFFLFVDGRHRRLTREEKDVFLIEWQQRTINKGQKKYHTQRKTNKNTTNIWIISTEYLR